MPSASGTEILTSPNTCVLRLNPPESGRRAPAHPAQIRSSAAKPVFRHRVNLGVFAGFPRNTEFTPEIRISEKHHTVPYKKC